MDFLKLHKRRSRLSEAAYIALNIALAVALITSIRLTQSPWLALSFVLLSKWRVLAVRPRFWFANIVANMVDIIVGVSVVTLLYAANGALWLQVGLTVLYAFWLLFIKPRSKRSFVAAQAAVAVFAGISALSIISYAWDAFFFVLLVWMIGYVATRHILSSYEEPHTTLYSLIGGCIAAELGWISFHWLMAYPLPGFGQIQFSQFALFATLLGLIAERGYASIHKYGSVRRSEVLLPILLTVATMLAMLVFAIIYGSDAL